jgi:hypothetical protein
VNDPLVRVRHTAEGSSSRMIVLSRADVLALLARAGGGLTLSDSDADVERLARAAWETADGEHDYAARFGAWGLNPPEHREHHLRAARRAIRHLIEET